MSLQARLLIRFWRRIFWLFVCLFHCMYCMLLDLILKPILKSIEGFTTPCWQEDYLTGTDCVTLLWNIVTLRLWWPGVNLNVFIRFRFEPISRHFEGELGVYEAGPLGKHSGTWFGVNICKKPFFATSLGWEFPTLTCFRSRVGRFKFHLSAFTISAYNSFFLCKKK